MAHARKAIKDKFLELLRAEFSDDAVKARHIYDLDVKNSVQIGVETQIEGSAEFDATGSPLVIDRNLRVSVMGTLFQDDEDEDSVDEISERIERAIGADPTLGGVLKSPCFPIQTDILFSAGDADGSQVIVHFNADYSTFASDPSTIVF